MSDPPSEYVDKYRPYPLTPREGNFKPKNEIASREVPIEDATTNRMDYIQHPIEKRQAKERNDYQKPEGNMDSKSSYAKDFIAKHGDRARPIRREEAKEDLGKFEGEATYKSHYQQWDKSNRTQRVTAASEWEPSSSKFEGESTFTKDFVGYSEPARKLIRPQQTTFNTDDPFVDATSYNDDYAKQAIPRRFLKKPQQIDNHPTRFNDSTTNKADYTGRFAPKIPSCKPSATPLQSDVPFESSTTFQRDFPTWQTERRRGRERPQYVKPEGNISGDTTNKQSYQPVLIDRVLAKRPRSQTIVDSGRFDGTTSYIESFKTYEATEKREQIQRPKYVPNESLFQGMSTSKSHYIPHDVSPRRSYKPATSLTRTEGKFDGESMYRRTFTPKKSERWEPNIFGSDFDEDKSSLQDSAKYEALAIA